MLRKVIAIEEFVCSIILTLHHNYQKAAPLLNVSLFERRHKSKVKFLKKGLYCNVSGKNRLQNKNIKLLNSTLYTVTEQTKEIAGIFFSKQKNFKQS